MNIVLFTRDEQSANALKEQFEGIDEVEVFHGELEDVPAANCLVAAGNSFGIMDGGLDAAMKTQFPDVQKNVQDAIASNFHGEIPVGQSLIVPSGDEIFPWFAYTPTMRFPRNIPAELVYDSMRGTLLAIKQFNMNSMSEAAIADQAGEDYEPELIESVAIPAFGTKTGGVGAFKAARMMRLAYESIYEYGESFYASWADVEAHLKKLYQER
jgi:O-acetyl-ADP-ribose deacetylase (regulator of RNase III)